MSDFAQYIADELTSGIAQRNERHADGCADFILRVDGDEIAYVDVEGCAVWLITVREAALVPAGASSVAESPERKEPSGEGV